MREKTRAKELQNRLDECQVLLAAIVLDYGTNGRLLVATESINEASRGADRTLAVRRLDNGNLRVDYTGAKSEVTMRVVEAAECL